MTTKKQKTTKAKDGKVEEKTNVYPESKKEYLQETKKSDDTNVSEKKESPSDKPKKAKESKAIYYNRKFNGEFKELENPLSLEQLRQRDSLPTDVSLKESEFIFEDGSVYSIGQQGFTNKDGKQILDNLK